MTVSLTRTTGVSVGAVVGDGGVVVGGGVVGPNCMPEKSILLS